MSAGGNDDVYYRRNIESEGSEECRNAINIINELSSSVYVLSSFHYSFHTQPFVVRCSSYGAAMDGKDRENKGR
jgi:hypothetical protein